MDLIGLALIQTAESSPRASSIAQAIGLGMVIVFVFSVIASGFAAKRIENLHAPTYSKAFLATMLKNLVGLTAFFVFGLFFQAPWYVAMGVAWGLVPIFIYKIVFDSSYGEATIIWLVATIVEVGVGYLLTVVGLVSLAAMTGGTG